jgi:hypothetical protein
MGAKDVEKRGSQSTRSSKGGKKSSPKEKNVSPKAGAPSTEAIQEGKDSNPKDKIRPSKGVVSNDKATKSPRTALGHVPNAETAEVLREAREGKNLLHYESLEEMLKDVGI